ncbi:MAG: hypothetical protein ABI846_01430 [Rudaea sp.]
MRGASSISAQTLRAGITAVLLVATISCHADGTRAAAVALRVGGEEGATATLDLAALDKLP